MNEAVESIVPSPKLRLVPGDYAFLALMVVVLISVTWIGVMAYEEGLKTEGTKRNGEAWAAWMTEAGTKRLNPDYDVAACAGGVKATPAAGDADKESPQASSGATTVAPATAPAQAGTWGACFEYLQTQSELKDLRSPFSGAPLRFEAACNPSDHGLAGSMVLEKLVPTPPGSSTPFVVSQLVASDSIGAKLQIRLSICDKGGDGLKVGEFEF